MSIVLKHLRAAVINALREEIELFRASESAKLLDERTFDPMNPDYCFLGQTGQNGPSYGWSNHYRTTIGLVPCDFKPLLLMTPLETWSAHYWRIGDKMVVLAVLRYIKGETDTLPELIWPEIN